MGTEKTFGYPLAILSGIAFLSPHAASPPPSVAQSVGSAAVSVSTPPSGSAAASLTPDTTGASTFRRARPPAESPELRELRLAERGLFPEVGGANGDQTQLPSSASNPVSCESPSEEWNQSTLLDTPPSPRWLKGLNVPDLPVPREPKIAKYIRYFSTTDDGRRTFSTWLRRSGRYRGVIEQALTKRDIPRDLEAVVFVESGCWPTAVSSAGATGLWQLMPQTARAYGLVVKPGFDERRSIWRSTEAAVTHLADLHAQFGSWHLALAAYNAGYDRLLTRMQTHHAEDFWTLSQEPDGLPRETILYVPKVLAVATILKNLEYFGFDGIEKFSSAKAVAMEVPSGVRLSLLARAAGTSLRLLKELNPEFMGDSTPELGNPVSIHLPTRGVTRAKSMLAQLLNKSDAESMDTKVTSDFDWGRDEFDGTWRSRLQRTGHNREYLDETVSALESRSTRTSRDDVSEAQSNEVDAIHNSSRKSSKDSNETALFLARVSKYMDPADARRLRNQDQSSRHNEESSRFATRKVTRADSRTGSFDDFEYRVRPGDTLSQIIATYGAPEQQVLADNNIRNPSYIQAGQVLRFRVSLTNSKE